MEEIHRDYAILKIEMKEIDGMLFAIFSINFKELTDNAKYKLKLIKEEDLSFVLSPDYGKPIQIDAQMVEEAIKLLKEINRTLKA